jgi:hypothetical protein
LVCLVGLSAGAAFAQTPSGYTVTTLRSTYGDNTGFFDPQRFTIDHTHRVLGARSQFSLSHYLAGSLIGLGLANAYVGRPATWAATTATSVAPTTLPQTTDDMVLAAASDDGQWQVVRSTASTPVYRVLHNGALTRVSAPANTQLGLTGINNQGVATGSLLNLADGTRTPVVWRAGQLTRLPTGGFDSGLGVALNNSGQVVGQVFNKEGQAAELAVWTDTTLATPLAGVTAWSAGRLINDRGSIVTLHGPTVGQGPSLWGLLRQGQLTPLADAADVTDLNHLDTALGRNDSGRAKLWLNGQAQDLTDWLLAKGTALPAGAKVTQGLAINDAGSMVLLYSVNGNAQQPMVRVTAKP